MHYIVETRPQTYCPCHTTVLFICVTYIYRLIKIGLSIDEVEGYADDDLPPLVDTPAGETNTKREEVD